VENVGDFFRQLGLTFVPLFVAMDAIGNLPIFLALTHGIAPGNRKRVMNLAALTALGVGLGFVAVGRAIFLLLGIEVADFLVAGGIILLVFAIKDLVTGKTIETDDSAAFGMVGVVPIGTPLVVGPAVLTTLLLLVEQNLVAIVVLSFVFNLAVQWVLFRHAHRIVRFLGDAGVSAMSKIVMLLLAAIAINMVRRGILTFMG
jgi:multiple antibiotic resistance protein